MELTHASFFSGVGGLDLGLERAGWRTVSFSEIDPYASAVLAERWPGVPNLGDIVGLADSVRRNESRKRGQDSEPGRGRARAAARSGTRGRTGRRPDVHPAGDGAAPGWRDATLWSGGFPCQDLSVAGKRAGLAGARSGLAYAFLDLVERHRPPAILLENVPGLLSSHRGKDFGALLGRLGDLGYWWAYRILDAQFFGVPQRRRRVFVVALHAGAGFGADSAAAVLSVGARCGGHLATGDEAGKGVAPSVVGSLDTALGHHGGGWPAQSVASGHVIADGQHRPSPNSGGVRAADGLAGGLDDREVVGTLTAPNTTAKPIDGRRQDGSRRDRIPLTVGTLRVGPQRPQDGGPGDTVPIIPFVKHSRYGERGDPRRPDSDDAETWGEGNVSASLDSIGHAPRTATAVLGSLVGDDPLLPLGLDSHRYRCCGNGVVANVSEWIGWRLRRAIEEAVKAA